MHQYIESNRIGTHHFQYFFGSYKIAGALAHSQYLAAFFKTHPLVQNDIELAYIPAQSLDYCLQTRHMAMMISSENVDNQIVAFAKFYFVISNVVTKISVIAV